MLLTETEYHPFLNSQHVPYRVVVLKLPQFQNFKLLIYGLLLVFMMLKRPEGLVPSARRSRELHQEEFLQDAWLQDDKLDSDDEVSVSDGGGEEQ